MYAWYSNDTRYKREMERLIRAAIRGDADAFGKVILGCEKELYKVAYARLSNDTDAADAMQSAILRCWEKREQLREPRYFKTWLIRILINECNRILRYRQSTEPVEVLEYEEEGRVYDDSTLEFYDLMKCLPENYRAPVVLYYAEGFSVKEIAGMMHVNENTVKTWLKRARDILAKEY